MRATLAVILVLVAIPWAGARAGSLEPAAAPAPTMKTLDQIPGTWSQLIPSGAERFVLVMGGVAVLDRETGLVWEQAGTSPVGSHDAARDHCLLLELGGRWGWRLPSVHEISTLFDAAHPTTQLLPPGHPFVLSGGSYWTGTAVSNTHYVVGVTTTIHITEAGASDNEQWCVRGRGGDDEQL